MSRFSGAASITSSIAIRKEGVRARPKTSSPPARWIIFRTQWRDVERLQPFEEGHARTIRRYRQLLLQRAETRADLLQQRFRLRTSARFFSNPRMSRQTSTKSSG